MVVSVWFELEICDRVGSAKVLNSAISALEGALVGLIVVFTATELKLSSTSARVSVLSVSVEFCALSVEFVPSHIGSQMLSVLQ